jgi:hypothetical protein
MRQPALPETHPPCHMQFCVPPFLFPPSLPACLQCELGEEDLPWYGALQGEQRAKFRSVLRQLHINVETLGGEGAVGNGGTVEWAGWVGSWRGRCRGHLVGRLSSALDTAALEAKVCSPLSSAALSCPARLAWPAEHDPDWECKKPKLGAKMLKLRGMLTQLRQAASSESCSCALRLLDAAGLAEAGGNSRPAQHLCQSQCCAGSVM